MEEALNEHDLLLVHRVLKKALRRPPHIKINQQLKSPLQIQYIDGDWYYYLRNQNDVLFKVLADTRKRRLSIYLLSKDTEQDIGEVLSKDGVTLARDLQREIKNNQNLLSFKKNTDLVGTEIWMENVFLKNHFASHAMFMSDMCENNELIEHCRDGRLYKWHERYDDTPDTDAAKLDREEVIDILRNVYQRSSVHYATLSLEGFMNMIYHILLRAPLRNMLLEQRLDWELKYNLMPYLCHGFTNRKKSMLQSEDTRDSFNKLKKYRNVLFHSKTSEALYTVYSYEDQLRYGVDLDGACDVSMPHKHDNLHYNTGMKVEDIVNHLIKEILNAMDEKIRDLATTVFTELEIIPLIKDKEGMVYVPFRSQAGFMLSDI
jgi:hypothetical protein